MKTAWIPLVVAFAAIAPSAALAQAPFSNTAVNRPVVSPYLNLLNQNSAGTSNYYTLVRPQIQAREELVRQQAQSIRFSGRYSADNRAAFPCVARRKSVAPGTKRLS